MGNKASSAQATELRPEHWQILFSLTAADFTGPSDDAEAIAVAPADLSAAFAARGSPISTAQSGELVKLADADGNGSVSFDEFNDAIAGLAQRSDPVPHRSAGGWQECYDPQASHPSPRARTHPRSHPRSHRARRHARPRGRPLRPPASWPAP